MAARSVGNWSWLLVLSILCSAYAMPSWYKCDASNCAAPSCVCASNSAPGGLTPEETPQFMLITNDDAVNPFSNKVVRAVIDKHTNPNGCNVPATWYTLQSGSDCATVKQLWEDNSEIALHTVNHLRLIPQYPGGTKALEEEMFGVRDWLNKECGIPLDELVGFRTPYLISNPQTREALKKEGILYDASMIDAFNAGSEVATAPGQRVFPFTMDNGIPIDCNWNYPDGQCNGTTERYPGLWEVPLWELQNAAGDHLFSMDPEGDVFAILKENFDMNYQNNRAPFGVFLHAPWYTDKNTQALNQFMDYAMALPNVWAVTTRQLIEWMKNPVPASQMGEWLKCKPVNLTVPSGDIRCQSYAIQEGDTAYDVATKFAVLPEEFLQANPEVGDGSVLTVGEPVRIPPWGDDCIGDAVKVVTGPGQVANIGSDAPEKKGDCVTHNVIPGDSWDSVASGYKVSVQDLKNANNDVPADVISPGVTLRVPPYKDSCPPIVNEARPSVLGESSGVDDPEPPSNGLRVNFKLQGRTKTEMQLDLQTPFKATVARALGINPNDIRIVNVTSLNQAAGLRRKLLQAEPQVEVEITIPNPSPLGAYANYTRDLSMESDFNTKELKAFGLQEISQPLVRVIENGVTMDVDASGTLGSTSTDQESESKPAAPTSSNNNSNTSTDTSTDSSGGLSTGAIVGIAVGCAVGAVLVAGLLFIIFRKKNQETSTKGSSDSESGRSDEGSPKMDPEDKL